MAWAIRYHQALRFYPDPSVGYEYPKLYIDMFGADYKPDPYIEEAYRYARNHKWYMEARNITVNDDYSFDPNVRVSMEPFVDIIGRRFKQPKEGSATTAAPPRICGAPSSIPSAHCEPPSEKPLTSAAGATGRRGVPFWRCSGLAGSSRLRGPQGLEFEEEAHLRVLCVCLHPVG